MSDDSPPSQSLDSDGDSVPPLTTADTPETDHSNMNSLPTPESRHSAMAIPLATPSIITSPQRLVPSAIRRARSPPRNTNNDIVCDHIECADKQPQETFRRLCEWNKHMDRHDRPYKCHEPGCELSLGFTYSGGLLRHQREVHKMHLSTKQPLYCPFPNCNRSSGAGFTRKENLEEHKRRRHVDELDHQSHCQADSPNLNPDILAIPQIHQTPLQTSPNRKRKRLPTPHPTEDENEDPDHDNLVEYPPQVKIKTKSDLESDSMVQMLRSALSRKDEIIRWQQVEIQKLQNMLAGLPAQQVYSVHQAVGMMSATTAGGHDGSGDGGGGGGNCAYGAGKMV